MEAATLDLEDVGCLSRAAKEIEALAKPMLADLYHPDSVRILDLEPAGRLPYDLLKRTAVYRFDLEAQGYDGEWRLHWGLALVDPGVCISFYEKRHGRDRMLRSLMG